ncbi:amidohydrolase family protein [Thalassotalea aquiviva]|uniref:amidohydrolase family protein n=1 Tax=Thalassotalea aquiviva TaxID=3242415 RepID=UPI00352BAE86
MSKLSLSVLATAMAISVSGVALAEQIAITGATVHTMAEQGTLDNATVFIRHNKIEKVVAGDVKVPTDYRVIDGRGKVVTPGLIGAYTSLGLVEVPSWAGINDSGVSKAGISAALDASDAITPDTSLRDVTRIEGFTSAASALSSVDAMFKGRGAIITLGNDDMPVRKKHAYMVVDLSSSGAHYSGGSRAAMWGQFKAALEEAKYASNFNFTPQTEWHGSLSKADAKALVPVLNGDMPLLVSIHRAPDIRRLIELKSDYPKLDITLVGATEAWRVADDIARAGFEVIINPEFNLPSSFDQNGATLANAARLEQAGVDVAIGMGSHNIRLATQNAGNAVTHGLSWQAGLASLTTVPAKIYGIDDLVGRLKAGMQADIVVWQGDPLEVMVAPEHVIINGEEVRLESRQTKLRDRYLNLDSDKPMQYTRP